MPWQEILALAHEPASTHSHRLGRAQTAEEQDWLTSGCIAFALKLIAARLRASTISPGEYRTERDLMLAEDRKHQLRLPSENQIRAAVNGWDEALSLAGLAPAASTRAPVGLSTVALLERCFDAHGTQPSALELRRFARANRIPWTPDRDRTWLESVAAWKQSRQARGLPVPDGPPARAERPDYAQNVGAARAGEHRREDWANIEDCIAHVLNYLRQLPSGERSTKRSYADWARTRAGSPGHSAFDKHGGWGHVRALALQRAGRS